MWDLWFNETDFAVRYERGQWIGTDSTDYDPAAQHWRFVGPEGEEYHSTHREDSMVTLARRYVGDLRPESEPWLLQFRGQLNGDLWVEHAYAAFAVLTGIGPIWGAISTDMTELQGIHLELAEARVDGQVLRPEPIETDVPRAMWGQVKYIR